MNKETSDRVSSIAGRMMARLRANPDHENFALTRDELEALAGTALSQDQTPGQGAGKSGSSPIHPAPLEFSDSAIAADPILHFFHYAHLPAQLQLTSRMFCETARYIVTHLPRNAERPVALRKLLEAKDAAVRANLPAPKLGQRDLPIEPEIGEPREIGGHSDDADGPLKFGD